MDPKYFDHTLLKADATKEQIMKVCREAGEYVSASQSLVFLLRSLYHIFFKEKRLPGPSMPNHLQTASLYKQKPINGDFPLVHRLWFLFVFLICIS